MPTSFQAVAVVIVALLPGALYIWAFERIAGRWGIGLSDRVFRFIGVSAIVHALLIPVTYWFWASQWPAVVAGLSVSWWLWLLAVGYVVVPLGVGTGVGYASRHRLSWARLFTGPDPAPRAWDYLFQGERDGWIRLRLKSGVWLGGGYATSTAGLQSYTAGYPEPQDIFLATTVDVDSSTGEFVYNDNGGVTYLAGGLLVRWDEVEYLQFIDA